MFNLKSRKNLDSYFSGQEIKKKIDKRKIFKIAAIIIAAVLVLLLIWVIAVTVKNISHSKNTSPIEKSGEESAVSRAAKHLLLPEEKPVIIEIKNSADLIKEQAFYAGAQDGDILLIYSAAKKAVIYSPARDIIVNVGPIYAGQNMKPQK